MLTGLLQTSEYARTIIEATGHDMADSEVDALVASRMARQDLLIRKPPVQLHTIIEEHVLTRPFGSDGAMGRQLRYLAEMASWPNITIQIIPRTVGFHPGMDGPFIILEYDDEPSLVWLENKLASLFLDEDE